IDPPKSNDAEIHPKIPLVRGFVGEVRAAGSQWSLGEIALEKERSEWMDKKYLNLTARNSIISNSKDRDLIHKALEENQMKVGDDMRSDATTMEEVIQF